MDTKLSPGGVIVRVPSNVLLQAVNQTGGTAL